MLSPDEERILSNGSIYPPLRCRRILSRGSFKKHIILKHTDVVRTNHTEDNPFNWFYKFITIDIIR